VRFYVPEWEDHVDADYNFEYDDHSKLTKSERDLQYVWDIFDAETPPIDGVLISREQIGESQAKLDRFLTNGGVHGNDSPLAVPDWLPTISDCGAWGYKSLPFPPYDNEGMLKFYENLSVDIGVTIDHLVLGSGQAGRLYLDKRAFTGSVSPADLPDDLLNTVDLMVDAWPTEWPSYVAKYEPSICGHETVEPFDADLFDSSPDQVLARLEDDPRAVYRDDDTEFRYRLTLENAAEMKEQYDANGYSFRLMAAVQGWDPESYAEATREAIKMGHQYIGIGGVAGSSTRAVQDVVTAVGQVAKDYERKHRTRVDMHVFGFAKTGAFDTIGRSGISSFDSASMLRAAWTGGDNYHLTGDRRYDALRVRYPQNSEDLQTSIEKALRSQELLQALYAFDEESSIAAALRDWQQTAEQALNQLEPYLWEYRWDDAYDEPRLRDIEERFRNDYKHGRALKGCFGARFRRRIVKLLRKDDPENPVDPVEYKALMDDARDVFQLFPRMLADIEQQEQKTSEVGTFKQVWLLVEEYATWIGDEGHLDAYEELLRTRPWEKCSCTICDRHGIDVAIFRGNNRNRRRGFHNKRRFYQEFQDELPKTLVVTPATASLSTASTIEAYLQEHHAPFWNSVHDLPVAEVGVVSARGVHEWWDTSPSTVSFAPDDMSTNLADICTRYQNIFFYTPGESINPTVREAVEDSECIEHEYRSPDDLRDAVLDRLGYEADFLPKRLVQTGLTEF
jgi:hypothetical protein